MPASGPTHLDLVPRTKHHAPKEGGPIKPGRALAPRRRPDTSLTATVRPPRPLARREPTTRIRDRVNPPIALMQVRAIMWTRRARQTRPLAVQAPTTMRRALTPLRTVFRQILDILFNSRDQRLRAHVKLGNSNPLRVSHPASMPSLEISLMLWPQQVKALARQDSTNPLRGSPNVIKQVPDIT